MKKIVIDRDWYTKAQKEVFLYDKARFKFVKWARRGGKSEAAMFWLHDGSYDNRKTEMPSFWISPIHESAKKIMDRFCKKFKKTIKRVNLSRRQVILFNDREIFFVGADKRESIEGSAAWRVVIDEARWIRDERVFTETVRPMLSDPAKFGGGHCAVITTPISRLHWFSKMVNRIIKGELGESYSASIKTALECGILSEQEIELARLELPPDIFARNYEAVDTALDGIIYKEFNPSTHLLTEYPKGFVPAYICCGLDFGATESHPTVFVVVAQDRSGELFVVLEEKYIYDSNEEVIVDTAKHLRQKHQISKFFADHNRADYVKALKRVGLNAQLAKKNVSFGITQVRKLFYIGKLGHPRLYFMREHTKKLTEEVENYCYKMGTEIPDKAVGFDDGMDALRYCIVMMTQKQSGIRVVNL